MKVVICEKPLVAKRLARILGADKMEDGYLIGNGYAVTWLVPAALSVMANMI